MAAMAPMKRMQQPRKTALRKNRKYVGNGFKPFLFEWQDRSMSERQAIPYNED
ncbi:MAG: hypothetical protein STSR0003_15760 [Smithella sp.]